MKRLPLVFAIACSLPTHAETAITVYSSARPGTLSPQAFRSGGEGMAVPGYALVREERAFVLERGRNLLRVSDVPALFGFNELLVISDGVETRLGSLTSDRRSRRSPAPTTIWPLAQCSPCIVPTLGFRIRCRSSVLTTRHCRKSSGLRSRRCGSRSNSWQKGPSICCCGRSSAVTSNQPMK